MTTKIAQDLQVGDTLRYEPWGYKYTYENYSRTIMSVVHTTNGKVAVFFTCSRYETPVFYSPTMTVEVI